MLDSEDEVLVEREMRVHFQRRRFLQESLSSVNLICTCTYAYSGSCICLTGVHT